MAGVNITNSGLLYTKFQQGIVETLNQEARTYKMPRQEIWRGLQIEGRVHVSRSGAMSFTEDGGAFSVASRQGYVPYRTSRRFYEAKIELTDGIMAAAKQSPQVARDVLESEVRGMMTGTLKYFNLFFFRDGTGTVALPVAGQAASAVPVTVEVDDLRLLWETAQFQQFNAANVNQGTFSVNSALPDFSVGGNAQVELSNLPALTAAGDRFVWNNSNGRAISGLDVLVDDALVDFQDVPVGTYPRYSSLVLDNAGVPRQLTPALLRGLLAGIKQKSGSERPSAGLKVIGDSWQAVEFEELYEGELRITPSDTTLGYAGMSFLSALGKIDLETDTDCLRGHIFAVDPTKLYHAVQRPLGWRLQNGQIFLRSDVSGVHTGTMLSISQMYIKERFTSGKITDLLDQATTPY